MNSTGDWLYNVNYDAPLGEITSLDCSMEDLRLPKSVPEWMIQFENDVSNELLVLNRMERVSQNDTRIVLSSSMEDKYQVKPLADVEIS